MENKNRDEHVNQWLTIEPLYKAIDEEELQKMPDDIWEEGNFTEFEPYFPYVITYTTKSGAVVLRHSYTRQTLLFSRKEDVFTLIEECRTHGVALNTIIYDIFPYGEDFPIHVPQLIEELYEKLNIAPEYRNYSESAMIKIDEKVEVIFHTNYPFNIAQRAELFPLLVAYSGEVIRYWIHGEWMMKIAFRPDGPSPIGVDDYYIPHIVTLGFSASPWDVANKALFNHKYRDEGFTDYSPMFMSVRSQLWDIREFRYGRE